MPKLILLRHLKSQWNKENKFTGWADVPLSDEGIDSAPEIAAKLKNMTIDRVYTSPLQRNKKTVSLILDNLGKKDLPVIVDEALNERNYGKLQGMDKEMAKREFGDEQIHLWRRSWTEAPPEGESLQDVYLRTTPFFQKYIERDMGEEKNVLVVASHNSLRAIIKYLEKIPDEKIIDLEIPYAGLRIYDFGKGIYTLLKN
jgi:2,3-bisphosphoglycerate-dependent phosphoglycerate mutase